MRTVKPVVRVPPEVKEQIRKVAAVWGLSEAAVVRVLLAWAASGESKAEVAKRLADEAAGGADWLPLPAGERS